MNWFNALSKARKMLVSVVVFACVSLLPPLAVGLIEHGKIINPFEESGMIVLLGILLFFGVYAVLNTVINHMNSEERKQYLKGPYPLLKATYSTLLGMSAAIAAFWVFTLVVGPFLSALYNGFQSIIS